MQRIAWIEFKSAFHCVLSKKKPFINNANWYGCEVEYRFSQMVEWSVIFPSLSLLLILFAGNYHALLGEYNELSHDTLMRRIHVSG